MKCPACGYEQDDKFTRCCNCEIIFEKFSPQIAYAEEPKKNKKYKRILKNILNVFVISVLIIFLSFFIIHKKRNLLFRNGPDSQNLIVTPLGSEVENTNYIYISGRISLKGDDSTVVPLERAIISFENANDKREILSRVDGSYEISLNPDIYKLTIYHQTYNIRTQEQLDLRKIAKLISKDFVLKRN